MRAVVLFALSTIFVAAGAGAQGTFLAPPPLEAPRALTTSSVFSADGTVRITSTFRIAVATKDTESLDDVKALQVNYDLAMQRTGRYGYVIADQETWRNRASI
jgi:hypothetical protein